MNSGFSSPQTPASRHAPRSAMWSVHDAATRGTQSQSGAIRAALQSMAIGSVFSIMAIKKPR